MVTSIMHPTCVTKCTLLGQHAFNKCTQLSALPRNAVVCVGPACVGILKPLAGAWWRHFSGRVCVGAACRAFSERPCACLAQAFSLRKLPAQCPLRQGLPRKSPRNARATCSIFEPSVSFQLICASIYFNISVVSLILRPFLCGLFLTFVAAARYNVIVINVPTSAQHKALLNAL